MVHIASRINEVVVSFLVSFEACAVGKPFDIGSGTLIMLSTVEATHLQMLEAINKCGAYVVGHVDFLRLFAMALFNFHPVNAAIVNLNFLHGLNEAVYRVVGQGRRQLWTF